jgi:SAM-dependent methyltransferase
MKNMALELSEYPVCAVCGEDRPVPLVHRKGYRVVRCMCCDLVYISPRPAQQSSVSSLYAETGYCEAQTTHACSEGRLREAEWRLQQLERHAPERGRLLDVGCSAGSFLMAARRRGWDVTGIDVSPGATAYARSVH